MKDKIIHKFLAYHGKHISKYLEEYEKKYNTNTIIIKDGIETIRNGKIGHTFKFIIRPNEKI